MFGSLACFLTGPSTATRLDWPSLRAVAASRILQHSVALYVGTSAASLRFNTAPAFPSAPVAAPKPPAPEQRPQKGPRYLLLKEDKSAGLGLLETALLGAPLRTSPALQRPRLPSAASCNHVLKAYVKTATTAPQWGRAARVAMALHGRFSGQVWHATLAQVAQGLAETGQMAAALPVLDVMLAQARQARRPAPVPVLSSLVDCAARTGDATLVVKIFERMHAAEAMPKPASMASLVSCFTRAGQLATATAICEWMRRAGMPSSMAIYTALLQRPHGPADGVVAARQLAQAQLCYDRMQKEGLQPDAEFLTAIIDVCSRASCMDLAKQVWSNSLNAGVRPDPSCYAAMQEAYKKVGDTQRAEQHEQLTTAAGWLPATTACTETQSWQPPAHTRKHMTNIVQAGLVDIRACVT